MFIRIVINASMVVNKTIVIFCPTPHRNYLHEKKKDSKKGKKYQQYNLIKK